jgi:hypothetical protein
LFACQIKVVLRLKVKTLKIREYGKSGRAAFAIFRTLQFLELLLPFGSHHPAAQHQSGRRIVQLFQLNANDKSDL